jgi:hypothetical protein
MIAAADLPDLHYFAGPGKGGKDVIPLYRDRQSEEPNLTPGLLEALSDAVGASVSTDEWVAYVYGILAHPAFPATFHDELGAGDLRIPITRDSDQFFAISSIGRRLIWLQTYGERLVPPGETEGRVPPGKAKCTRAVPDDPERYPAQFDYDESTQTLRVGEGEFHPVEKAVWEFEVSGLEVVKSWLRYRMKNGYGRTSSPLDEILPERWPAQFTTELLELLWVLEHTIALYPRQAALLDAALAGPLFHADDLPPVPDEMRKPPKRSKDTHQRRMWEGE